MIIREGVFIRINTILATLKMKILFIRTQKISEETFES